MDEQIKLTMRKDWSNLGVIISPSESWDFENE